jgi:hypothetical protein
LAEDGRDRCARCSALQALELPPAATHEQIKSAHRLLVKVWHPDRFPGDPKLKQAADEKLKAINAAYVLLTSDAGRRASRPPKPSSGYRPAPPPPATVSPRRRTKPSFFARLLPSPVTLLKWAVLACGLILGVLFLKAADSYLAAQPVTGRIYSELRDGVEARFREAASSIVSRTGVNLRDLLPHNALPLPASGSPPTGAEKTEAAAQFGRLNPAQNLHRRELGAARAESARLMPYITIGLTENEVKAIQGAPTSSSDQKLTYGNSELYFTAGKLSGWRIDPASAPLRVKLWPDSPVNPDLAFFRLGSPKSVVVVVQGTPTYLSENQFGYGGSIVYFRDDRVVNWKDDPGSVPLRVAP